MSLGSVQKNTTFDPQNTEHLQLTVRPKLYGKSIMSFNYYALTNTNNLTIK